MFIVFHLQKACRCTRGGSSPREPDSALRKDTQSKVASFGHQKLGEM